MGIFLLANSLFFHMTDGQLFLCVLASGIWTYTDEVKDMKRQWKIFKVEAKAKKAFEVEENL